MNLKIFIFIVLVSGIFPGCKSSDVTVSNNSGKNSISSKDSDPMENTSTEQGDSSSQNNLANSVIQNTNGSTGGNMNIIGNNADISASMKIDEDKLFSDLMMTNEQIREYEVGLERFKEKQRNSPNGEMMGTIPSERDRLLKKILSQDQFKKYGNWKKKN